MNEFKDFLMGKNRQWLMGFAILMVIFFHFAMYGNLLRFESVDFLVGKGGYRVDIFIFLSCYGLCYSYRNRGIADFYKQRVRRLYPMYLVYVIALVTFFAALMPYSPVVTGILQITGLSSFFGMEVEWYVPALIVIYALFPLLYKFTGILYRRNIYYVLAVVFLLVLVTPLLSKGIVYLFAIRFPLVIISIASYYAVSEESSPKLLKLLSLSAVIGLCPKLLEYTSVSQSTMLILPLVLYGVAQLRFSLPFEKFICFCGRHSFELYLAQNLAFNQFLSNSEMAFVPKSIVALGILVVGATLLWAVQELWKHYVLHAV